MCEQLDAYLVDELLTKERDQKAKQLLTTEKAAQGAEDVAQEVVVA